MSKPLTRWERFKKWVGAGRKKNRDDVVPNPRQAIIPLDADTLEPYLDKLTKIKNIDERSFELEDKELCYIILLTRQMQAPIIESTGQSPTPEQFNIAVLNILIERKFINRAADGFSCLVRIDELKRKIDQEIIKLHAEENAGPPVPPPDYPKPKRPAPPPPIQAERTKNAVTFGPTKVFRADPASEGVKKKKKKRNKG